MTGVVDRMIWWNGTDTIASDTFDIAMLIVNRNEKATRVRLSRVPRVDSLSAPKPNMAKHPIEVAEQWTAVRSQGNFACFAVSVCSALDAAYKHAYRAQHRLI